MIGDPSPGNTTGVYVLGCEARARCRVSAPTLLTRSARAPRCAPSRRRAQHDLLRGVLQLTDAGNLPACLAGLTYASRCDVPPVRVHDGSHTELLVERYALLTLMFVNCGDERVSALGVDYILLNPGGQNLPTAEAPLPIVYLAFALAWGLVSAACGGALFALRRYCTPLHVPLLSVPLLKVVHMAVAQAKWSALSKLGVRDVPLDMTLVVVLTVSQVDYLGMLLLLSRGWHVSRTSLGAPERNSLLLSLALLASLYFVYHLWSPRSFFALAVAYICVLGFALSSVSYGLRHLKAQAHLLRMSGTEADDAAAWVRVRMFAGFHGSMFIFTCVKVVLHLVALFMPEEAWLNVLFAEARAPSAAQCSDPPDSATRPQVADIGLALVVAVLFRPRESSPCVEEDAAGALRAAAGNVIAGRGRLSAPTDEDLARAIAALQERASTTAPEGGESRFQVQLPVLVENPCGFDTSGRQVMSVSVGLPPAHKPEDVDSGADASGANANEAPPAEAPAAADAPPQWHLHASAAFRPSLAPASAEFRNPLWERRLTQTEPQERDAAADRFRVAWGAPPSRPSQDDLRSSPPL